MTTGSGAANFQIGANASDGLSVSFGSVSTSALSLTTALGNYNGAQSVANAIMIKRQLREPIEGEYSSEFLARFPALKDIVKKGAPTLDLERP